MATVVAVLALSVHAAGAEAASSNCLLGLVCLPSSSPPPSSPAPTTSTSTSALCLLGLLCKPPPSAPAPQPPACTSLGSTDLNPTNTVVPPMLGKQLFPRPAGRVPFGFNDYAVWAGLGSMSQDMALHKQVGSSVLRVGLEWGYIEATRNQYTWGSTDKLYCAAMAAGITPLFTIWTTPSWAATDTTLCLVSPCRNPPKPAYDGELQEFAGLAALRYPKAVFEIWNEPNLGNYWGMQADPARYTQLLAVAYRGIKNSSPGSVVLGGSLSNNSVDQGWNRSMQGFLRGMYAAGAGNYMDGVSFHPYPVWVDPAAELTTTNFQQIDQVLSEQGELGQRHLVASEVGASTAPEIPVISSEQFTESEQSTAMMRAYDIARSRSDVDAIVYHALVLPVDPGYGWVRKDLAGNFRAKRVYCDFATQFGVSFDCSQPVPTG